MSLDIYKGKKISRILKKHRDDVKQYITWMISSHGIEQLTQRIVRQSICGAIGHNEDDVSDDVKGELKLLVKEAIEEYSRRKENSSSRDAKNSSSGSENEVDDEIDAHDHADDGDENGAQANKTPNARGQSKKESKNVDSDRMIYLKRCVYACGMRKNYKKIFYEGMTENKKEAILEGFIREFGVTGRISINKCKAAYEESLNRKEIQELDTSLIIEGSRRRSLNNSNFHSRPQTCDATSAILKSGLLDHDADSSEDEEDHVPAKKRVIAKDDDEDELDDEMGLQENVNSKIKTIHKSNKNRISSDEED